MLQRYNGSAVLADQISATRQRFHYPTEQIEAIFLNADGPARTERSIADYADQLSGYLELQMIGYSIDQQVRALGVAATRR